LYDVLRICLTYFQRPRGFRVGLRSGSALLGFKLVLPLDAGSPFAHRQGPNIRNFLVFVSVGKNLLLKTIEGGPGIGQRKVLADLFLDVQELYVEKLSNFHVPSFSVEELQGLVEGPVVVHHEEGEPNGDDPALPVFADQ
jgi:hypothetical protein